MQFTAIEDVERYLAGIPKFESDHTRAADFNLQKFEQFCNEIGNPHEQFPAIHVAGTNGKGSVCRMLASIYREAGYTTGLYTSPHILEFSERFVIDGHTIPDEDLVSFFQEYYSLIKAHKLTYFEISTAIAFWWFSESNIDIAIIETGLGGRLDATNIIAPLASVITSISLDHTDILGDTLPEIAREKGGIIKSGCPVIVGKLPEEAVKTLRGIAEDKKSALLAIEDLHPEFKKNGVITLQANNDLYRFNTPLQTPIQALNVAIAWRVIEAVNSQFSVSVAQFRSGLRKLDISYGRFEKLHPEKRWYFDGAHNIEAVKAVKESVSMIEEVEEAILVLALMRDKVQPEVMNEFSEFKNIYYYSLNTERAAPFQDIKRWWPQVMAFPTQPDLQQRLFKEFDSELVIFAGSFYFYATVRDWIKTLV